MKLEAVGRFGLGLIAAAALAVGMGCASTVGWGPAPPMTAEPASAQQGAPRFVQTKKEEAVKVPSWIRVQDCTIVAISSPSRYACPDGKVYTSFELARARQPQ